LGTAYYKKGDYIQAIDWFKQALREDSTDNESTQLLGLSYYLRGHPAKAIPFLEKVQTWYSRANVDASYILGQCYIQTKDYPRARQAFAKMFDLPSDSAASYLLTARMLFRREFEPVQRSIWLDATATGPYILMGKVLQKKGEPELAIRALRRAAAMDPNNSVTHHLLGQAYRDLGQKEESERELRLAGQLSQDQDIKQ
jgi:tetratricopeptide (TPR) repeat protein